LPQVLPSREGATEIGNRVKFSAQRVFLANPEDAMSLASENGDLEGTIVGFSDSGTAAKAYAVVEVVRKMSLVVPVDDLNLISNIGPSAVDPRF
jgi:hypothetical protein